MRAARRRRRRRRLWLLIIPVAAIIAVIAVVIAAVTGKVIVPGISGKVYPIKYEHEIAAVAEKYDIDPYLLAAVARTESGFNPDARSPVGAVGLMQFLPTTADFVVGLDSWKGPDNPALNNPEDSLELGACYLSYLLRRFDDPTAAIAAYNAGPGAVGGWVEKAGGSDSFTAGDIKYPETREFVRRVFRAQALFEKAHPDVFAADGRTV